jgi:hypothetical protein
LPIVLRIECGLGNLASGSAQFAAFCAIVAILDSFAEVATNIKL